MTHTLDWWTRAVAQVGFPIAVASALLWLVLSGLPGDIVAARSAIAEVKGEVGVIRGDLTAYRSEAKVESARLGRIMQQICVNTATTPEDRRGCFPQ